MLKIPMFFSFGYHSAVILSSNYYPAIIDIKIKIIEIKKAIILPLHS